MAGFWENYGKENAKFVQEPTSINFEKAYSNQWTKYLSRKEHEMLRREKEKELQIKK